MITIWIKASEDKMVGVSLDQAEVDYEDGDFSVVLTMDDCEDLHFALSAAMGQDPGDSN